MERKKTYSFEEVTKLINHLFENSDMTNKNINLSNNLPIKEIRKKKIVDDMEQKEKNLEKIDAKGVKEKEENELIGHLYIFRDDEI